MSDDEVKVEDLPEPDDYPFSPQTLRGFMETEEGKLLLASRNYDAIIGTRMTLDDLVKLNRGRLR